MLGLQEKWEGQPMWLREVHKRLKEAGQGSILRKKIAGMRRVSEKQPTSTEEEKAESETSGECAGKENINLKVCVYVAHIRWSLRINNYEKSITFTTFCNHSYRFFITYLLLMKHYAPVF